MYATKCYTKVQTSCTDHTNGISGRTGECEGIRTCQGVSIRLDDSLGSVDLSCCSCGQVHNFQSYTVLKLVKQPEAHITSLDY